MSSLSKRFSFIVVAGGQGKRAAGNSLSSFPKQFHLIGGRPMWFWSVECALTLDSVDEIIIVIPDDLLTESAVSSFFSPSSAFFKNENNKSIKIVKGGEQRADSVMNGLTACSSDFVLIHDAARPYVSGKLCKALMEKVSAERGAIPVLPVSEALKKIVCIKDGEKNPYSLNYVNISAVERENIFGTQTPQVFPRLLLIEAIRKAKNMMFDPKDEAEAWLLLGYDLAPVEGERLNFKVTWPEDFRIAEGVLSRMTRTGLGYDIHPLVPGRKLILGGVEINSPLGLLGHSDADALVHAVCDAILGGAELPDIGILFPASDEKYKGANSIELLTLVVCRVRGAGWEPTFIDCVIEAQTPKLSSYIPEMKSAIEKVLGCVVNIKAKSGEHIPPVGDAACIVCHVAATMTRFCNS
jgi:2-C-methyl-D-erythritol 4-phosphate cytidylyltransferase/2-C-methyl-D-erythritol 2,4-cyclodiphosphate synthase